MRNSDLMKSKINEYVRVHGTKKVMSPHEIFQIIGKPEKAGSILITDYCYNRYNNGLGSFDGPHLFERLSSSRYRVLGENYPFTGPVYHKPQGEKERIVGYWENGVFSWKEQPFNIFNGHKKEKKQAFNDSLNNNIYDLNNTKIIDPDEVYDDDQYMFIEELNLDKNVLLLMDKKTGALRVRKGYTTYNKEVFERIKKLNIHGLPQIYNISESKGKLTTYEEYIHGKNLLQIKEEKGLFREEEIFEISLKLCSILSRLHNLTPPLIHRDIKPSNIMMCSNGEIILIDFNASKVYKEGNSQDTVLYGTQYFAAHEQFGYGQSSIRTDIYSI